MPDPYEKCGYRTQGKSALTNSPEASDLLALQSAYKNDRKLYLSLCRVDILTLSTETTDKDTNLPQAHQNAMSSQPYIVNARFSIKPERKDEFLSIILDDKKKTLTDEPLAVNFAVGEDLSKPNTFYLHEEYLGEEGFEAHMKTPHFKPWAEFCDSSPWAEGGDPVPDFYFGTHSCEKVLIPSGPVFCVNAEYCVKPEFKDKFLKLILETQEACKKNEPLCLRFVYGENKSLLNSFHLHKVFTGGVDGKEGFDEHKKTEQYTKWETFSEKDPFTKTPIVGSYASLEDVKEVLEPASKKGKL